MSDDRRTAALELVRSADRTSLEELASRLGVSQMTVRRDLDELQRQGLVRRVRGGAVPLPATAASTDDPASTALASPASAASAASASAALPRDARSASSAQDNLRTGTPNGAGAAVGTVPRDRTPQHAADVRTRGPRAQGLFSDEVRGARAATAPERHVLRPPGHAGYGVGAPQVARTSRPGALERIARAVAASLSPGSSVLLDAGPVTTAVAQHLRSRAPLTVAVTSLDAALALADAPDLTVLVLGGQLRPVAAAALPSSSGPRPVPGTGTGTGPDGTRALLGPLADQAVAGLGFDVFVMSPAAVHPVSGWAASSLEQAGLQQAGIARAERTVVAAEASVLTTRSLVRTAALGEVTSLVTDASVHDLGAPLEVGAALRALAAAGVEVVAV